MSDIAGDFREYWSALIKLMGVNKRPPEVKDFVFRSWSRPNAKLAASINRQEGFIHVNVTLFGVDAKERFDFLQNQSADIEHELGQRLSWERRPQDRESWIRIIKHVDPSDRRTWPEQHKWFARNLQAFLNAFDERLNKLS
jgi:Domain of unknown function (DUF4268)